MRHVAENHTFLQRARDLARILKMRSWTTTFVSGLYDIGREAIDGRSIRDYTKWAELTLKSIKDPFVFFLDKSLRLKDTLLKMRSPVGPIQIIETSLNEIPMSKYYDQVKRILEHPLPLKYPKDITNILPYYVLIQYSKFGWLEKTISANLFKTAQFSWIDAGFSRFYDTEKTYTSIKAETGQFYCKVNDKESIIAGLNPETYITTNECILQGGLWVMSPNSFPTVKNEVMRIWEVEMLSKGRIDNEQIALALTCKTNRSVFQLVPDMFAKFFSVIC
jgi:hypothetical protein